MKHLPQADRFCDDPSDNPYWNESAWFSFSIPQRRMHGAIQYYFRPNMRMLNGGPMLWDPTGTFSWNCLYYNWSHLQALPAGAKKFDMTANNTLSVRVLEPLACYAIRYDLDDFELDLEWQAIGPVHELRSADPGQKSTAKFHMEQPGRMTGSMHLDGEHFAINCFSMRDTSYGPRDYAATASGSYYWGIADESAFHSIAKGEGAVQNVIGGFLWRDGQMASLTHGARRVLEFGRYGPKRVAFEAVDTLGRSVSALGSIDEGLIFAGYTDHTVVWSLCEWDVGGVTHWGDNQDFCPALRFRRIARGEIALG